mmetsp:Transcript_4149/g.10380  ORF Transcript_4149/g.10380 Transcript_4149/m.10380 type:complete len:92 (-) Transcript_4149:94-369(-)|eukprot:CAMPEP_0202865744 /NCGR_PEP_ID=MMETSP1391-20130828/6331_1 /ASSEMBLY_ACC=CAM_ASM_000867 /TAXON_ID=1034604 /ORGANISM="Chlamydomonas leiostraca, Strain SAG 11-49" /LENGTH=91 /DNA_ID=CAMNT_0049545621 /DNA_START=123 /DNA_END=398 /DNA_ORIENTATION=-
MSLNAGEVRSLFRAFLREGRKFNNYNIREYILRRAKEGFRAQLTGNQSEAAFSAAKEELQVVRRQSVVYQMYGRPTKNVMELDQASSRARQ